MVAASLYYVTCAECGKVVARRFITATDRAEGVFVVRELLDNVRAERDSLLALTEHREDELHDDLVHRLDKMVNRADAWLHKVSVR